MRWTYLHLALGPRALFKEIRLEGLEAALGAFVSVGPVWQQRVPAAAVKRQFSHRFETLRTLTRLPRLRLASKAATGATENQ